MELLVVVSIIALLIAILLPSLRKAREQAKRVVCANHLHQLVLAHQLYAYDHDGRFVPNVTATAKAGPSTPWFYSDRDGGVFARYWYGRASAEEPLLECPSDRQPYPLEKNTIAIPGHLSVTSYALNGWTVTDPNRPGGVEARWGVGCHPMSRIRQPAQTMFMAEIWRFHSIMDRETVDTGDWNAHYNEHPGDSPLLKQRYPGNLEWDDRERHGGLLNFVYVDAHVDVRSKDEGVPKAEEEPNFWGPRYDQSRD